MENGKIKYDLLRLFNTLLDSFPNIGIKYEDSVEYGCFIVSIDVAKLDEIALEEFSSLYGSLKHSIQGEYGDDAPLFCLNEEWFSLSDCAISYYNERKESIDNDYEWMSERSISIDLSNDGHMVQESKLLSLAA